MAATGNGLVSILDAATRGVDGGGPARFALVLRQSQDPVELVGTVADALEPLGARVAPLSDLEPSVLVVELPDRELGPEPDTAFAAAHALRQEFVLASAEPDLPTGFFPVDPPAAGSDPRDESATDVVPGCFAPTLPELDGKPRWALTAMNVQSAWALSEERMRPARGEGAVIAQPDTGVTRHAELDGVTTVWPFDVLDGDPDPSDPLRPGNPGHGTGTASVAVSGESLVVCGSAPRAQHMPIRAVESVIRITQVSVARAIDWAVAHGAHVVTMSLGGIPSIPLYRALRRAVEADVIVLAAAGNCVGMVVWPARYEDCIAVAATDSRDAPWRGSCHGSAVDVSAPGENVVCALVPAGAAPGNAAVGQNQGTSFAVALTAGVAALWVAHHGRANLVGAARARGETLQQMFRRLVTATARRPGGWDVFEMGGGIVDARSLLSADLDLGRDRESVPPPADPRERAAGSVRSLVAEAVGSGAAADDLDWYAFGPEIATAVLTRRLAELDPSALESTSTPTPLSPQLAAAIGDPALRTWLGLDKERP